MLDQVNMETEVPPLNALVPTVPNVDEGKLTAAQVTAKVKELGKKEGQGENSRPGLFLTVVEAAQRRAISKEHVPLLFADYSKACAAARGIGWKPQDSEKQQVSKLAVAVRLGELPHVSGMDVMNKVISFQKEQRAANEGKMDFSPYDGFVKVARFIVTTTPDAMPDDDVIRGLLVKPEKALQEEADRLARVMATIEGLAGAKENPVSEESIDVLVDAGKLLAARIEALGGTTAQRRAAAKHQAKLTELVAMGETARRELSL